MIDAQVHSNVGTDSNRCDLGLRPTTQGVAARVCTDVVRFLIEVKTTLEIGIHSNRFGFGLRPTTQGITARICTDCVRF